MMTQKWEFLKVSRTAGNLVEKINGKDVTGWEGGLFSGKTVGKNFYEF